MLRTGVGPFAADIQRFKGCLFRNHEFPDDEFLAVADAAEVEAVLELIGGQVELAFIHFLPDPECPGNAVNLNLPSFEIGRTSHKQIVHAIAGVGSDREIKVRDQCSSDFLWVFGSRSGFPETRWRK